VVDTILLVPVAVDSRMVPVTAEADTTLQDLVVAVVDFTRAAAAINLKGALRMAVARLDQVVFSLKAAALTGAVARMGLAAVVSVPT
jgi:hypothetical protein